MPAMLRCHLEDISDGQRFVSGESRGPPTTSRPSPPASTRSRSTSTRRRRRAPSSAASPRAAGTPRRCTMRLLVDDGMPLAGGVIGARRRAQLAEPTRPGDVLRVASPSRRSRRRARGRMRGMMTAAQRDQEPGRSAGACSAWFGPRRVGSIGRPGLLTPARVYPSAANAAEARSAWASGEFGNGLSRRRRRRHGQRGPRNAEHPRRAGVSRRRDRGAGLAQEPRHRVLVRRPDAEDPRPRQLRLHRLGHRALRDRLGRDEEVRADRREGRLRGDRQLVALPLRPRRAADRAGGEPGRDRGLRQEEHHRQPELLDRADGGGAEAAARPGADQAGGGRDLPVGLAAPARRRWTSSGTRPRASTCPGRRSRRASSPSRSPSTSSRRSTSSWRTAPPARSGRWSPRPRRSSTRRSRSSATCVRVPVFVGHSEAVNVEFEDPLDEDEAREILREAPGVLVVDKREAGGYVTPVECVGDYATYVSRIRTGPDGRQRPDRCGWSPTTCARARRSTRCRSPSCSAGGC